MNFRLLNLYLLVFWAFVGITIVLRKHLLPEDMQNPARDQQLDMLGYLALALALWNAVRWWMIRNNRRRREAAEAYYRQHVGPLAHKEPPVVTDPQFRFDTPEPPPPHDAGR